MSVRPPRDPPFAIVARCALLGLLAWTAPLANAQSPGTATPGARILLVDDDDSDNNSNPASGALSASDAFYRKLLQDRSIAFDTVVVPRYSNGPGLDRLKPYPVVLWYTGASYGGNRDNTAVISLTDEKTLTDYLRQGGGTVLLFSPGYLNNVLGAGGQALWEGKESAFLQGVLGIKGGRGLLQRFKEGTVRSSGGPSFEVKKSPTVEVQFSAINPGQAETLFTATLDPDGKGPRPVAVATRQAFGAGHAVLVAFTFENIANGAGEAFGQLLPGSGVPGAAATAVAAAGPAAFSPRRARAQEMTATGTGRLGGSGPFVARRARTAEMTASGTGVLGGGPPFVPRRARAPDMAVTGTGSLR